MKLLFILLSVAVAQLAAGLKSTDFCKNLKLECSGNYAFSYRYIEKCEKVKCFGTYGYSCRKDLCATNTDDCHALNNIRKLVGSMFKLPNDLEKYKKFYNFIKECPTRNFILNTNDVCLTGKNCFFLKGAKFHTNHKSIEIVCPCRGTRSYHCGNKYCTTNNLTCDLIKKNTPNTYEFQKCFNDNQLIEKKF